MNIHTIGIDLGKTSSHLVGQVPEKVINSNRASEQLRQASVVTTGELVSQASEDPAFGEQSDASLGRDRTVRMRASDHTDLAGADLAPMVKRAVRTEVLRR